MTRIFVGVFGVPLLGLGIALIVHGIMVPSLGYIVVGVLCAAFASWLVAGAFRPDLLVVDHEGLYLRRTFGSQQVSWDDVRAFRAVPTVGKKSPSIQVILCTGTIIELPHTTDSWPKTQMITAQLTEALREHTKRSGPLPQAN